MAKRLGKRERALRKLAFSSLSQDWSQTRETRQKIKIENLSQPKPNKPLTYASNCARLGVKAPRFRYPAGNIFKNYPR